MALRSRLGLGEACSGNLRVSKDDRRRALAIIAPTVAVQGILRRHAGAVGCHIDELITAGDIASSVDSLTASAHAIIDDDAAIATELDAKLRQPKFLRVGASADRDKQALAFQNLRLAFADDLQGDAIGSRPDAAIAQPADDRDALCFEVAGESRADLRLRLRQEFAAKRR